MDNLNTHKPSALYETFLPQEGKRIWDRFELIYAPKHGSWLNMAEIEMITWLPSGNNNKATSNCQYKTDDAG